jgi:NAD(P)-dependent dehydrogenase (short-subunit alcohol dehydrogenase family)
LAVRLIRQLLDHGDYIVACLPPHEIDHPDRGAEFRELIAECKEGGRDAEGRDRDGWKERIRGIRCDGRSMAGCGAAIAEAVEVFGRIDILLCCKSEGMLQRFHCGSLQTQETDNRATAVVGTVEELSTTPVTRSLVRDQFESLFFSQVNFIKAALPVLRAQHTGHIVALTSTGGHIATPGMSMYSAATWGLEGFCDSLAYEVAPFNIKITIVQPNQEIQSLTNKLTFAPQISAYRDAFDSAPNIRDILGRVLDADPETAIPRPPPSPTATEPVATPDSDIVDTNLEPDQGRGEVFQRYPRLPPGAAERLVMETVHALTAIGGHENPPARHIVGTEAAIAVREKLKTVSEELEDFVDASLAVDIFDSEVLDEAREGEKAVGGSPAT